MLLGRFLTRSGDQAWDFAVPIVLIQILPGHLRIAALYYLLVRVAIIFLLPKFSMLIDQVNRLHAARIGIFLQLIGVIFGFFAVVGIKNAGSTEFSSAPFFASFLGLTFSGIVSQLGSTFMDISIANDLVPSSFSGNELSNFNSRLRQLDLFTEVTAPIAAGALLLISPNNFNLLGFSLVAIWNIISFIPEYWILKSIFKDRPDLKDKLFQKVTFVKSSLISQITKGWRSFFKEPVAGAIAAYSLLWMSVLSPHGVLLTAFLKDGWKISEWAIGAFRGSGAVFGLLATVLFPLVVKRSNVARASLIFLVFQTIAVSLAFLSFIIDGIWGQMSFLILVLLSRIGLYGFSLGEVQIRQEGIRPEARGEINGFANALTTITTVLLFTAGVILPSTEDFKFLVLTSVIFVFLALITFSTWYKKHRLESL